MDFFSGLGLRCPREKGEADFLQDVTLARDQAAYRADKASKFLTPMVRCCQAGAHGCSHTHQLWV